jgi:hypothetical protein
MSKPIPPVLFALKAWTIKQNGDKCYIRPSVAFHDKPQWSKGYRSLQAACSAIARKLAEEWSRRSERRQTSARLSKRR